MKQVVPFTQIVLETVAGLVGVGEAGVERGRPVVLDLLLDVVRHLCCWISAEENQHVSKSNPRSH